MQCTKRERKLLVIKLKNIVLYLLILINLSCVKEGKKSIPIDSYDGPIIMRGTSSMYLVVESRIIIQKKYSTDIRTDEEKIMFSYNKNDHYFKNDDVEVEFSLTPWKRICDNYSYNIYRRVLIGAKHIEFKQNKQTYEVYDSLQGYYLYWVHPPLGTCFTKGKYNDDQWGISNMTDTVITNLPYTTIKELFPDFSGIYLQRKYSHIYINLLNIESRGSVSEDDVTFFK